MSNSNILVVEDDRYSGEVVAIMLKHNNLGVEIATSGEKALNLLRLKSYGLVLIDLALPGMNGWELLEAIKSDPRLENIPCAAMTAYHDSKVAHEAAEAGFALYFAKPLHSSFLKDVQRLLAG
jgi:CheY-like chemotaxis protein